MPGEDVQGSKRTVMPANQHTASMHRSFADAMSVAQADGSPVDASGSLQQSDGGFVGDVLSGSVPRSGVVHVLDAPEDTVVAGLKAVAAPAEQGSAVPESDVKKVAVSAGAHAATASDSKKNRPHGTAHAAVKENDLAATTFADTPPQAETIACPPPDVTGGDSKQVATAESTSNTPEHVTGAEISAKAMSAVRAATKVEVRVPGDTQRAAGREVDNDPQASGERGVVDGATDLSMGKPAIDAVRAVEHHVVDGGAALPTHVPSPVEARSLANTGRLSDEKTLTTAAMAQIDSVSGSVHEVARTPNRLEIGVHGGSLGWVSVRADLSEDGNVRAVIRGSETAASELRGHVRGMMSFLASESVPVAQLSVENRPVAKSASTPVQQSEPMQQGGADADRQQRPSRQARAGTWRPARPEGEGEEVILNAALGGSSLLGAGRATSGGWLSVRV